MSISHPINDVEEASGASEHTRSGVFDDSTVDCYRRRNQIVSEAHRTEWWMAIAVLLLIAGVGFVVL